MIWPKFIRISLLLCALSWNLVSNAQTALKQDNISFNSVFQYDTSKVFKDGKVYRFIEHPNTSLEVSCFDHDMEPDSSKLNRWMVETLEKFESLKKDSSQFDSALQEKVATTDIGRISLDRGFFGLYKKIKVEDDQGVFYNIKFDTYNYDEHCFCEFKYKRNFGSDTATFEDTSAINEFVSGLKTLSLKEVRAENQKIRDRYRLIIDTLPLENYWIHVYYKEGKMTRDSLYMEDLDSSSYKPRFTHYNITYKANIIFSQALIHSYRGIYLDNLKSAELNGDTLTITLRDAKAGVIQKRGTITIENSLGYPIELPFYISYRNHLYEKLRRVR